LVAVVVCFFALLFAKKKLLVLFNFRKEQLLFSDLMIMLKSENSHIIK